jgi:hypothetical protein
MIYAFLGRKRSGKNTAAELLKARLTKEGFTHVELAFADSMKRALSLMFNTPETVFHDQTKKETPCIMGTFTPRELLCWYGDMMKTKFGPDFFVKVTREIIIEKLITVDVVIITDLRFPIETYALIRANAHVIYMNRDKVLGPLSVQAHESEASVYVSVGILKSMGDEVKFTEIDNNGTIEQLRNTYI